MPFCCNAVIVTAYHLVKIVICVSIAIACTHKLINSNLLGYQLYEVVNGYHSVDVIVTRRKSTHIKVHIVPNTFGMAFFVVKNDGICVISNCKK